MIEDGTKMAVFCQIRENIINRCNQWLISELNLVTKSFDVRESMIYNLCMFDLTTLSTPQGVEEFRKLIAPLSRQKVRERMMVLATEFRLRYGSDIVKDCYSDFRDGLRADCLVPCDSNHAKTPLEKLIWKNTYLWIVGFLQVAFKQIDLTPFLERTH